MQIWPKRVRRKHPLDEAGTPGDHSAKVSHESSDQLSAQNSLKINIKFLDSLLDIEFYSLTIIFFLRFFP